MWKPVPEAELPNDKAAAALYKKVSGLKRLKCNPNTVANEVRGILSSRNLKDAADFTEFWQDEWAEKLSGVEMVKRVREAWLS